VERYLFRNRSAKSQYRILSSTGKLMSSVKRDLLKILDTFNVQIDNPCVILMQDTSREFIAGAKAKDKYRFFQKATQLEKMNLDYTNSLALLNIAKSNAVSKARAIPLMEQELALRKEEFDAAQSLIVCLHLCVCVCVCVCCYCVWCGVVYVCIVCGV
jgi:structural maintenance of chromosomes protein 6